MEYITHDDHADEAEAGGGGGAVQRQQRQQTRSAAPYTGLTQLTALYRAARYTGIFSREFLPGSFYQKKFTRKFLGACLFRTHDRIHDNSDQDGAGDGVPFSCWFVFFAAPRTMIADVRRSRPPLISRIPQRIRRSHPPNPPIFRGVSTARNRA